MRSTSAVVLHLLLPTAASALRLPSVTMSASAQARYSTRESGVLWDVDGTLVESTELAFVATNEVCAHARVSA